MDPNISATDEEDYIYKDLSQIVPDGYIRWMASMRTDEQIIRNVNHFIFTDDDGGDFDDAMLDEYDKEFYESIFADSSPTPEDPADRASCSSRPQNNILNPRVEDRNYTKFTPEEVEKLIGGVEQYGRRWAIIQRKYFSDSTRTTRKLKDKWRHMLKSLDTTPKDSRWRKLYKKAKDVDDKYPKDGRSKSFINTNNN